MTALSIREMNYTMVAREQMRDALSKNAPRSTEPVYYWQILRKSKKAKPGKPQWVFVRDLAGTKAAIAVLWCKWFRDGNHRLKCVLKYPEAK